MCSIIGFSGKFDSDLLLPVFENSRLRGIHSFGFSFYNSEKIETRKFLKFDDFVKSINKEKPNKFIAHFRYSTSGDWLNIDNNQPLFNLNTSIAFNGVISQKTKEKMEEEYNLKLEGDNDGYVLLNKLNDFNFLSSKSITFAFVGLSNKKLIAMKNSKRPLWKYESEKFTILASTNDILKRSKIENAVQLTNLKLYEIL